MELIVAVVILALLGVLTQRFGYDSRDGMRSKEYDLARCGVVWDSPREQAQHRASGNSTRVVGRAVKEVPIVDQPEVAHRQAA
jgi:hypothetical protein